MRRLVILRPEPGAARTAQRAGALGLDPVIAPIFAVRAIKWTLPSGDFDAVMLTSANAPRLAGDSLAALFRMPCYAVGEATAAEALDRGFTDVRTGSGDAAALAAMMAGDGIRHALHPCGVDHRDVEAAGLRITAVPVYVAEPVARLPADAAGAIGQGAVALVHSPRAAEHFAALVDQAGLPRANVALAAISAAAADAAGPGWRAVRTAGAPRDAALLELAAELCKD